MSFFYGDGDGDGTNKLWSLKVKIPGHVLLGRRNGRRAIDFFFFLIYVFSLIFFIFLDYRTVRIVRSVSGRKIARFFFRVI